MAETIFEAYNNCKKQLASFGIEDYVFEAKQIIRHITGYTNAQILSRYNERLSEYQSNRLIAVIGQRKIRYPLQYIIGKWSFYGREFSVGPGVLIPRADTEILVEKALELTAENSAPEIIDLCAGTGCIGITLGLERPGGKVILLEKYPQAARYAAKNITDNKAGNVTLEEGDVLAADMADKKFDLIVSNPPYVTDVEMENLQPEVQFEPLSALAGGTDGCDFYRAIINNYSRALKNGGHIALEVGAGMAEAVAGLLRAAGYKNIGVKKDYSEIERVVFGTLEQI